ncbi:hypothetical protein Hanom_Chr07g00651201 [Helianthus anomalus]
MPKHSRFLSSKQRFLEGCGRATARASFSVVVLIFRISIEILDIYYVWPGLFLVPVSFGSGTFNGQDPPLMRYTLVLQQ